MMLQSHLGSSQNAIPDSRDLPLVVGATAQPSTGPSSATCRTESIRACGLGARRLLIADVKSARSPLTLGGLLLHTLRQR